MMRQAVGVGVERRVAQRAVLEHHRHRVRRARRLRGKQLRQASRAARDTSPCAVSFHARRMVSRSAAPRIVEAAQRARRHPPPPPPAAAPAARPAPPPSPRRTGRLRIPARPSMPAGAPSGRAPLDQPERQVELGARGRDRLRPRRKPRQLQRACAAAAGLERQHHLEQRVPRQRPRRIEHLHQPLERQVLVRHRPQGCRARTRPSSSREARVARGVGAQHQRVDEEPDQLVQRRIGAARDRAADARCRCPPRAASAARQAPPAAP